MAIEDQNLNLSNLVVRSQLSTIALLIAVLVGLPLFGALGFHLIEGWNLFDSLYMAVITITTVGFGEVHPLSHAGKIFVMLYLFLGLGLFLFSIVQLSEFVTSLQIRRWFGRRKMDTALKALNEHFIVCGFGRMGRVVCQHLAERDLPFVAIERSEEGVALCEAEGWTYLRGDATDDRVLLQAGIERARGLAAVLSSDADNLYVVLSSRLIAPKLQIIARALDEHGVEKLRRAGANRVVSVYRTSGGKMAQFLANPNLEEFFEVFTTRGSELDLAEIRVDPQSPYADQPLKDTDFRRRGVIIVGIRRQDGHLVLPPGSHDVIRPGDSLLALGKAGAIDEIVGRR